jgi:hypothetical protein
VVDDGDGEQLQLQVQEKGDVEGLHVGGVWSASEPECSNSNHEAHVALSGQSANARAGLLVATE